MHLAQCHEKKNITSFIFTTSLEFISRKKGDLSLSMWYVYLTGVSNYFINIQKK